MMSLPSLKKIGSPISFGLGLMAPSGWVYSKQVFESFKQYELRAAESASRPTNPNTLESSLQQAYNNGIFFHGAGLALLTATTIPDDFSRHMGYIAGAYALTNTAAAAIAGIDRAGDVCSQYLEKNVRAVQERILSYFAHDKRN